MTNIYVIAVAGVFLLLVGGAISARKAAAAILGFIARNMRY